MIRTFFLLFFTVLITGTAKAQLFDSISNSFKYKPKFFIKLDARKSFITNVYAPMGGVKIGLSFNNTTRIGIGYTWMKNYPLSKGSDVKLQFSYVAPFIEYCFYKTKKWTGEIPVQLGYGEIRYRDTKLKNTITKTGVFVYEPAMTLDYRFLKYFSLGAGAGLRLVFKLNQNMLDKFSSPIYIFRFKIYFGDIYKEHLKKQSST